ncbi:MAG: hypothetical protein WC477_01535 [Patescibacteria group bacterium]
MKRTIVAYIMFAQAALFFACPTLVHAAMMPDHHEAARISMMGTNSGHQIIEQPLMTCCNETIHTEQTIGQISVSFIDGTAVLPLSSFCPAILIQTQTNPQKHLIEGSPPFQERSVARRE